MNKAYKLEGATNRLRNAVIDSGKTPAQIQAESGIGKTSYYNHMNGQPLGEVFIAKYCRVLNISADWLLGLKKE